MTAEHGWAVSDLKPSAHWPRRSEFWPARLVVPPASAVVDKRQFPFFSLTHIGGTAGLARWIRFCEENCRLVEPLAAFHRNRSAAVWDHINAMCSAIEFWAGSWTDKPGWRNISGKPSGGLGKLHVVAARLGKPWEQFVGDLDKWAKYTWDAYLSSKHYRPAGKKFSIPERAALARSAELLLTATMLDEASQSKKVSRAMLGHHQLIGLSDGLKKLTS